jgi:hypothetical protein
MAAGKFTWYTSALKYFLSGRISLDGDTIVAMPLGQGYTPSTASHSALAQITDYQASASSTLVNTIALSNVAVTQSGVETAKFDADDISGFSSDGSTITSFKWLALYAQSASSGTGIDNLLVGFMDMDTSGVSASAGNSTQVNITWSTDGIGKLRGNP